MPVVRPEAYSDSTAWMATYMAGVLNVSNMICVIFSRLALGLSGASVSSTGCSTQLVVEGVVPDRLPVVPVGDDAVLDRVLEREDASLGLGLVADVGVLLSHADHDALVAGPADDRREHGPRSVVSGEAGLAHAGAVVDNESSNIFVTHGG